MNAHPKEKIKMPPEEYLEFERNSEMKHEYFDGEILADFTEAYDRGTKSRHYRLIPSLQEYILVSQHSCLVEKYVR